MFDSLRSLSFDQIGTLLIAGAGLCLLVLYRLGYLTAPAAAPRFADRRAQPERRTPAAPEPSPLTRLGEPPTTQALADQRKAVDAALDKRLAQLELELETVRQARGTAPRTT